MSTVKPTSNVMGESAIAGIFAGTHSLPLPRLTLTYFFAQRYRPAQPPTYTSRLAGDITLRLRAPVNRLPDTSMSAEDAAELPSYDEAPRTVSPVQTIIDMEIPVPPPPPPSLQSRASSSIPPPYEPSLHPSAPGVEGLEPPPAARPGLSSRRTSGNVPSIGEGPSSPNPQPVVPHPRWPKSHLLESLKFMIRADSTTASASSSFAHRRPAHEGLRSRLAALSERQTPTPTEMQVHAEVATEVAPAVPPTPAAPASQAMPATT
ncbi:hypothetical protein DACRYDRAFT_112520 [Dacryopinax primogenitus]|uniref:Uncharacterized protein n=1 Tax=Dacryopinax primogenitus (strain DJM 731) TaxID=1858805 RepID=M5FN27_DACPD|nr:uncharacterized protein DACRYDRAFT_112520 [Dacryopinax primogenitus]EJT96715.1 hypothetical protein DACRYDRAFT_112520 [Dacryopinax primogenitus]